MKVHNILVHNKKVKDQSELSAIDRLSNMRDAFKIQGESLPTKAYLLDDLVTSGATILGATKALEVRNIQVLGVLAAGASI